MNKNINIKNLPTSNHYHSCDCSLPLLVDSSMTGFLVSGALLTCLREQNAFRFVYNFHVVHPVKVRTFSKQ